MNPETNEPFDSPLEEVLAGMPETEPPVELEARCLGVVRDWTAGSGLPGGGG